MSGSGIGLGMLGSTALLCIGLIQFFRVDAIPYQVVLGSAALGAFIILAGAVIKESNAAVGKGE